MGGQNMEKQSTETTQKPSAGQTAAPRTGTAQDAHTGTLGHRHARLYESPRDGVTGFHWVSPHPRPIPQALESVHAGFPSVAQDYFSGDFSLDANLVAHPDMTFVVTVAGDSMENAGIYDGDILIVDRSLQPRDHDIVIAAINGELTVKRLRKDPTGIWFHPENPRYPDIHPEQWDDTMIWGVVIGNYHWQCSRAEYGRVDTKERAVEGARP